MSSEGVDTQQKKEVEDQKEVSQQKIEEQPINQKQIELNINPGDQMNQRDTQLDNEQQLLIPQQIQPSPQKQLSASRSQFNRSVTSRASVAIATGKQDKRAWFENLIIEKRERDCLDVCCFDIGAHKLCCTSSGTKKDFLEFGIGINLYYRFLKQIGWFFFVFTILSLPQIFFSVLGYLGSNYRDSSNPFEFLMATTIGATSLSNRDCQIQLFQNALATPFTLQCASGDIAGTSFYYGIINSNEQDCLYMSLNEINLNTTNENSYTQLQQNMDSKTSYTFTLSQTDFTESVSGKRVYAGVKCKDATLTLGGVSIKQKIVPIIFASCDALIILLFMYFLINLTVCESHYQKTVAKEQPMIQNFSLQISNLPKADILKMKMPEKKGTVQYLTQMIKEFIDKQLQKIMKNKDLTLYDLQVSEQEQNLKLQQQLRDKKKAVEKHIKDLEKLNQQQFNQSILQINGNMLKDSYQQFYDQFSSQCNPQHKKTLDEKNKLIMKLWDEIDKLNLELEQLVSNGEVKYIWVTFDTMQQKLEIQQEMQSLPIDWFKYSCCFCCLDEQEKENLLFEQHKLQVKEAPNPENINWLNLNYSLKQRIIRQLLSFILTIALLIGSFVFISWVNQQKANFQQQYPTINCSNPVYSSVTLDQVQAEIDGTSLIKGYVECYCKPKINQVLAGSIDICSDWGKSYAFQQSLPWVMVAGLIIVNVIIQYTFIFLSSFEKHLMISEEYSARIFKIFLAQFLNTGLILLISNADFGNSTKEDIPEAIKFLFGGKYGDIDAKWCQNIGIVLLLTLLVNVATQPVMLLIEIIVRYFRRAWDQCSCCLNQNSTRQNDYQEFRDLYLGEQFRVELRYAQILNAIYVCFMYSPALPFLYFTTLMTIIFLYLVDKISLFKTYRKPVMLDQTLSLAVRKYLWIVIIVHLGFATYIYGSSNLFYESIDATKTLSQLSNFYDQQNVFVQWWERSVSQFVTLILLALLALVVLGLILRNFFYKPMKSLFSKCFACCNNKIKDFKQIQKFLSAIQSSGQEEQQLFLSLLQRENLEEDLKFTIYQQQDFSTLYDNKYYKICQQLKIPIINQSDIKADVKVNDLPIAQSYVNQSQNPENKNQFALQQPEKAPLKQQPIQYKKVNHLIGLRSYHISYNPNYRKYYDWDKISQIPIVKEQPIIPFIEEKI